MVNLDRTGKLRPGGVQGEYSRGRGTSMGWQKGDEAKRMQSQQTTAIQSKRGSWAE